MIANAWKKIMNESDHFINEFRDKLRKEQDEDIRQLDQYGKLMSDLHKKINGRSRLIKKLDELQND